MVKKIFPVMMFMCICSCNQLDLKGLIMPTGAGVEKRFEQSAQMCEDMKAGSVATEAAYSFYVATDPHINETYKNLGIFNDALRNDAEAAFGVVLGDCIDVRDNLPKYLEALSYRSDAHSFNPEIFHVLGNHDLYFNGWENFKKVIGPSVFWFEATFAEGKDLYISLDSATGTLGSKQTKWFRSFLSENRAKYRHCVILTHTNFFYTDNSQTGSGNMPFEESLALIDFLGKQNVSLALQGHDHSREDLMYDNVRYVILGAIQDKADAPEYLKIDVNNEGLTLNYKMIP